MKDPRCIGIFSALVGKGGKSFRFEYYKDWISSHEQMLLDPDLVWYSGLQYPDKKENCSISEQFMKLHTGHHSNPSIFMSEKTIKRKQLPFSTFKYVN
jgi:hypothetical protein